jgi:hypothetical protein
VTDNPSKLTLQIGAHEVKRIFIMADMNPGDTPEVRSTSRAAGNTVLSIEVVNGVATFGDMSPRPKDITDEVAEAIVPEPVNRDVKFLKKTGMGKVFDSINDKLEDDNITFIRVPIGTDVKIDGTSSAVLVTGAIGSVTVEKADFVMLDLPTGNAPVSVTDTKLVYAQIDAARRVDMELVGELELMRDSRDGGHEPCELIDVDFLRAEISYSSLTMEGTNVAAAVHLDDSQFRFDGSSENMMAVSRGRSDVKIAGPIYNLDLAAVDGALALEGVFVSANLHLEGCRADLSGVRFSKELYCQYLATPGSGLGAITLTAADGTLPQRHVYADSAEMVRFVGEWGEGLEVYNPADAGLLTVTRACDRAEQTNRAGDVELRSIAPSVRFAARTQAASFDRLPNAFPLKDVPPTTSSGTPTSQPTNPWDLPPPSPPARDDPRRRYGNTPEPPPEPDAGPDLSY